MRKVYRYEDDEGTWFEENSPLTVDECEKYGITLVEEREDEDDE